MQQGPAGMLCCVAWSPVWVTCFRPIWRLHVQFQAESSARQKELESAVEAARTQVGKSAHLLCEHCFGLLGMEA
jgi:hypothetical protein